MNPEALAQVKILRQQIPVGYTEGMELLRSCAGDIEQAAALLQQRYLARVSAATKLEDAIILPLLIRKQYDVAQTIIQLEQEYRLIDGVAQQETVYTLHRWQADREYAVHAIAGRLLQDIPINRQDNTRHDLHHFSWYVEAELRGLNPVHRCVIALTDWLDYEYWEGLTYAIRYYPDLMAAELRTLQLPELAAALQTAWQICEETREQYPGWDDDFKSYLAYSNAYQQNPVYRQAEDYISANQQLITEHLFDFIQNHTDQFP